MFLLNFLKFFVILNRRQNFQNFLIFQLALKEILMLNFSTQKLEIDFLFTTGNFFQTNEVDFR